MGTVPFQLWRHAFAMFSAKGLSCHLHSLIKPLLATSTQEQQQIQKYLQTKNLFLLYGEGNAIQKQEGE